MPAHPVRFGIRKIAQAVNYFAAKYSDRKIDITQALKLIWAADRYHIRKYGTLLTNDTYYAMKRGPVGSVVKNIIEEDCYLPDDILKYSKTYLAFIPNYHTQSIADVDTTVFSETDIEAMEFSFSNFGHLSHTELSKLSHKYPEWRKHKDDLMQEVALRCDISPLDFFENPEDQTNDPFSINGELLEINKELFIENSSICSTLK